MVVVMCVGGSCIRCYPPSMSYIHFCLAEQHCYHLSHPVMAAVVRVKGVAEQQYPSS